MSTTEQPVLCQLQSGVAQITFNRPEKRNALTRQMIEQLGSDLTKLEGDESLRALVLQASGPAFCAGMDLGEMQSRATEADAEHAWLQDSIVYANVLKQLYFLPVPTLAVVQGPALAGGMGIVLACDLVIAADNVFFALPEPVRGITAAMVTPLLVQRVGVSAASQLLLSGRRYSASESLASGLCHEVMPADQLESARQRWVQSMLTGSPAALRITKQHLHHCAAVQVGDLIDYSVEVSARARETADAREGLAAFLEKRNPKWQAKN